MSLDKATVARIAKLARIDIPPADQEPLAKELSNIVGWVEQLAEVDTNNVEPLRAVMPIDRAWRADKVADGAQPAQVTANAPKSHDAHFVVPKVVE